MRHQLLYIMVMIGGFFGYLGSKALVEFAGAPLKNFFDPFFIGIFISIALAILGSKGQKRTAAETEFHTNLHILPQSEQNLKDYKIDKIYAYVLIASGAILTWLLITYWAVPYNEIKGML